MKKHIIIILLASLLLLCACQPTPESPIVVGKDQSAMIDQAREKPGYTTGETVDWRERLAVPERYSVKLKSNGGRLTVDVDAEVIVPDAELPIAHVSPRRFSGDDAQRFVKALLGDDPQCISREGDNRTKAMYERMIVERNYALDNWDDYGCIVWDMYDTREEMQEALLPFSQIQEIFEKMMPVVYANFGMDSDYQIEVKEVRLCLWRIFDKDSYTRGILAPVWCFYGSLNGLRGTEFLPILILNAVDGSVIDPQKGY